MNYLYELSKTSEDFNKLLKLVSIIISKNEYQNKINISEFCIINHMIYTFRKMNSSKSKGDYQVDYCILLIKEILPKIFLEKGYIKVANILNFNYNYYRKKSIKNGLFENIRYNPNLNFDKKLEIYDLLNKITNGVSDIEIGKYFPLYLVFKYFINKQTNEDDIIFLYNKFDFFKNIINEFSLIIHLYDYLYYLCNIYDKKSYNKYIDLLNDFKFRGDTKLINYYKTKYDLSENNIKKLFNLFQLFVNKCNQIKFKIKFKNESENKSNINENEIKINFILSDENLSKYALLDMLKKNKKDFSILKILFKLNDEYLEIIEKYKEQIIMLINLNIENLCHYLYSSEILRYISKKDMQNKTLMNGIIKFIDPK